MKTSRDALATKLFPVEWAQIEHKVGASKRRQKLRQRAEIQQQINILTECGAKCANYRSFSESFHSKGRMICIAKSDFDGEQMTDANEICLHWSEKHD
jgi:hypothetical protein